MIVHHPANPPAISNDAANPLGDPVYTLDELAQRLGKPDARTLAMLMPHEEREVLIHLGAQIRSSRILVDESRIYSLAYAVWSKATPEQKGALLGFSGELLAVAVDRALALRQLSGESSDGIHDDQAEVSQRALAASQLFHQAQVRRDQAVTVLRSIVGGDALLRNQLDAASGGVIDGGETLARVLERTAEFGRTLLAHQDDAVATRIKLARLDAAYFASLDASAKNLREATRGATARAHVQRASQADLDLLDGINLSLLRDIVRIFEVAHEIDGGIPRLVPLATRRLLGKRSMAKAAPTDPAPSDPAA